MFELPPIRKQMQSLLEDGKKAQTKVCENQKLRSRQCAFVQKQGQQSAKDKDDREWRFWFVQEGKVCMIYRQRPEDDPRGKPLAGMATRIFTTSPGRVEQCINAAIKAVKRHATVNMSVFIMRALKSASQK
jgi:hypothetical protein